MVLRELSRRLHLPMAWLREEAAAGRIPCLKAGTKFVFDEAAVRRALLLRASGSVLPIVGSEDPPSEAPDLGRARDGDQEDGDRGEGKQP